MFLSGEGWDSPADCAPASHTRGPGDLSSNRSVIEPTRCRASRTVSDGFGNLFGTGRHRPPLPLETVLHRAAPKLRCVFAVPSAHCSCSVVSAKWGIMPDLNQFILHHHLLILYSHRNQQATVFTERLFSSAADMIGKRCTCELSLNHPCSFHSNYSMQHPSTVRRKSLANRRLRATWQFLSSASAREIPRNTSPPGLARF